MDACGAGQARIFGRRHCLSVKGGRAEWCRTMANLTRQSRRTPAIAVTMMLKSIGRDNGGGGFLWLTSSFV
jgi:hypothetical protein